MGTVGRIRAIPAAAYHALSHHPGLGYHVFRASFLSPRLAASSGRVIAPDEVAALAGQRKQIRKELEREAEAGPFARDLLRDTALPTLDLDKDWHCLHFVLCGPGLGLAILGREAYLEDVDLHLGLLSPFDVELVADELRRLDFPALERATRGTAAPGVYRWTKGPKPHLVAAGATLAAYYADAASEGRAAFTWRA